MKINKTKTYEKLKNKPQTNNPDMIIVHHSGGTDKNPMADTSHHTAKDMEAWHLSKGWDGIGYHYVIHKDGAVWAGRPEHYHGAHCKGKNKQSIGICLSGNFDATDPTQEQKDALVKLMLELVEKYGITREKIYPHRKFANKSCFGARLPDDWARIALSEEKQGLEAYSTTELIKEILRRIRG